MVARFVDVGATVTKGQEIAALDPAVQALAVRSAEASLANAEAQFANAQAEEARQKDLVQRNITPQAQYDLTRRNLETTTANLTRARASLRKAKDALGYTRLDADFDGVITNRYAEPGQVLTAGQKVVTLARPEVREAVIAVPDKLAEQIWRMPSDFTITVDARPFGVDQGRRRARDRSHRRPQHAHAQRLPHPERPAGGLSPRRHRLGHLQPAGAPRTSTCRRRRCSRRTARPSSGWSIRPRSTEVVVTLREVTVGSREGDRVVVTSGIAAGERIVIAGVHSLTAGQYGQGAANERLQPLDLGAAASLLRLVPDAADRGGGRPVLHAARPRGGSRLHHQEHGGLCELARRHGRGDDQPGHRPHRAQAAGARHARLHQELHDLGPDHDLRQSQGRHARAAGCRRSGSRCATR